MNKNVRLVIFFVLGVALGFALTLLFPQRGIAPNDANNQATEPADDASNEEEMSGRTTQYMNASANDIIVNITDEQSVTSPLTITGQAIGPWYFEATAPVDVVNWDGLIIGSGYIEAESDWMTENFVPFSATLNYSYSENNPDGWIIIRNANASGEPQFDKAIEIPVQLQ